VLPIPTFPSRMTMLSLTNVDVWMPEVSLEAVM
jgi:hypothetical protein